MRSYADFFSVQALMYSISIILCADGRKRKTHKIPLHFRFGETAYPCPNRFHNFPCPCPCILVITHPFLLPSLDRVRRCCDIIMPDRDGGRVVGCVDLVALMILCSSDGKEVSCTVCQSMSKGERGKVHGIWLDNETERENKQSNGMEWESRRGHAYLWRAWTVDGPVRR